MLNVLPRIGILVGHPTERRQHVRKKRGVDPYIFVPWLLFECGEPPYLTMSASRSFLAQAAQSSTVRTDGCRLASVIDWP